MSTKNYKHAYYTIIRYIPSILREEFINIGVILVCPSLNYQSIRTLNSFDKSSLGFKDSDGRFVRYAITKLVNGFTENRLNNFVDFSFLENGILTQSGLVQLRNSYHNNIKLSNVRSTITEYPEKTLEKLYQQFISKTNIQESSKAITRTSMLTHVKSIFSENGLFKFPEGSRLNHDIELPILAPKIDFGYKNKVMHYYHVIPFTDDDRSLSRVQTYRQTANDLRESGNLDNEYQNAKFMVLGYTPQKQRRPEEIREIKKLLEKDNIETRDYKQDIKRVAKDIRTDLIEHAPSPLQI